MSRFVGADDSSLPPGGTAGQILQKASSADGDVEWVDPGAASGEYVDEDAQDAIGTILVDSSTIDFTYDDATPSITADVKDGSISAAKLSFDVATQAELDAHVNDPSGAHPATAISYAGSANLSATTVEAALDELDAEKAAVSHSHAASDITGTKTSAFISDFAEAVDDRVGALLNEGTNITLTYDDVNGTLTIDADGGGASALDDLSDVTISSPTQGQVLKYNGSAWVNDTDETGGEGGGSLNVEEGDTLKVAAATVIDFDSTYFTVTAADTEANVTLKDSALATQAELDAHTGDTSDAHDASAISVLDANDNFTGTDVEAVLEELFDAVSITNGALTTHLTDASDAHDASAISYAGGTGMSATDVEAAIDELATEKANQTALDAIADEEFVIVTFCQAGTLTPGTGVFFWTSPANYTITGVRIRHSTGTVTVDVNINGTTIFTTQANRPATSSATTALSGTPNVTSIVAGDELSADIDVASSGSNLVVQVIGKRA